MSNRVPFLLAAALAIGAWGCGETAESAPATTPAASIQLSAENIVRIGPATLSAGPAVSGQLTPAREATVRAQVGGSIVSLSVDRGDAVRAGDVVAKIASRDLDEAFESAKAMVASAETTLAVAQSERQRTETLVKGGAVAARELEIARNAVSNAEAQVAAAKARQRAVWQQLDDTSVRAPFAGVVSERTANMGDVIAPGGAVLTVIDPSSMRLEALVPSEEIGQVRPGAVVHFSVRGYPNQPFTGRVERLSPTADPVTRQVSIFVSLPNAGGKLIAGLFAEGRVDATTRTGLVAPLAAVDETGPMPTVTRIRDGKADRVAVGLGVRQADRELVEITSGLAAGDTLIVGSAKGVAAGTIVKVIEKQ